MLVVPPYFDCSLFLTQQSSYYLVTEISGTAYCYSAQLLKKPAIGWAIQLQRGTPVDIVEGNYSQVSSLWTKYHKQTHVFFIADYIVYVCHYSSTCAFGQGYKLQIDSKFVNSPMAERVHQCCCCRMRIACKA